MTISARGEEIVINAKSGKQLVNVNTVVPSY